MNEEPKNYEDMLPLSAATFQILFTLVEGEKHGYAIRQDVEAETEGSVVIHIGSLYNHIRRLQKYGLITESEDRPLSEDDSRRRYYRLTERGKKVLLAEADRVRKLVVLLEEKNIFDGV